MSKPTPVTFGYWNIRGLAQPIRLLMEYLKVEYKDRQYNVAQLPDGTWDRSEWTKEKETLGMSFPNLPYLLDGDVKISESIAIMRHLVRKYKPELMGKTDPERAQVDELVGVICDLRSGMAKCCYGCAPAQFEANKDEWFKGPVTYALKRISDFLGDKKFLVGDLTYVDFILREVVEQITAMAGDSDHKTRIPETLKRHVERVNSLVEIRNYMKSERYMTGPWNNKMANFK
eukprot:GHVU01181162.1.p1 GENE.GHVU01181162.1~~GHVU01181162.1.p1  ORF type:complete len:231 (-),score=54.54 GHVU01181162.1:923-1615(-)